MMMDKEANGDDTHALNSTPTPFGRPMREHFLLDKQFTNLNHGSFGTYPKPIQETMRQFQDLAEARPDPFIRYAYPKLLDESRAALAAFLDAPTDEVVFVQNATTGVNTVLRNLIFHEGDSILYFSTTYGACAKTVEYISETTPAKGLRVTLEYPISDDALVEKFQRVIRDEKEKGAGRVRVAIIDTVVSMPGVRMPFERMVEVCREEGVFSLVDGAHGVGHVALSLKELDADFFVSNCHKWLFVPRGCAVFHVPKRNQALIRTALPTSHGFIPRPTPPPTPSSQDGNSDTTLTTIVNPLPASSKPTFITLFEYVGTIDATPYLCIPAALTFRRQMCGGERAIREYCFDLAQRGGRLVAKKLGTEVLPTDDDDDKKSQNTCCFTNVRLPLSPPTTPANNTTSTSSATTTIIDPSSIAQSIMHAVADDSTCPSRHATFIAVIYHHGAWWARLSAQIYLDLDDFARGADTLVEVCREVGQGWGS